jgi:predicted ArsR family transcriptional regulator
MSCDGTAWRWAWDQDLPTSRLIVLLFLASHCEEAGGMIAPSVAELAQRTGLSRRGVQRALHELVHAGLIQRHERRDPDGGRAANAYTVNVPLRLAKGGGQ